MKFLFACLVFLLTSCVSESTTENPEKKTVLLPSSSYTEYWMEQKDPDILYFAGSHLEWRLSRDSIEIVKNEWTDAVECHTAGTGKEICNPFNWYHHFVGTYQSHDSTLTVHIRYHHSEPENAPVDIARDSQATFRVRYSADSSEMQVALLTGANFLKAGSKWQFRKLEHHNVNIVSAEVSNDCGPADGPETRMKFLPSPCPNCSPGNDSPYDFYLGFEDVDKIESGLARYATAWRCGSQGCTDSSAVTVEFIHVQADSVSGRITLRKGMTRSMGLFSAPKKRQKPFCG